MTVADKLRDVLDLLTASRSRQGSDTCGCDDCAKLRRKTRLDAITKISSALKELE